jgi:hypothetical protein
MARGIRMSGVLRISFVSLIINLALARGQTPPSTLTDIKSFPTPDKKALVLVEDVVLNEREAEVVSVIDARSLKCVFAFQTHERVTTAFWSPSGRRCLIRDSPDDGNTFFYLVSKSGRDWNELSLDSIMDDLGKNFESEESRGLVKKTDLYRGAPYDDGIKWINDDTLSIKTFDQTGDHLFRITVAPNGKSFVRTMTALTGPVHK